MDDLQLMRTAREQIATLEQQNAILRQQLGEAQEMAEDLNRMVQQMVESNEALSALVEEGAVVLSPREALLLRGFRAESEAMRQAILDMLDPTKCRKSP